MSQAIDDLKHEHDALLSALQILEGMGTQVASGKNADKKDIHNLISFLREFKEYTNLLRAHIQKENNVLFPMAEQTLTPSQLASLYDSFEEHEEAPWGAGTALVISLGRVNGQL